MSDTPPDIEMRMTELIMRRPAGDGIRAACEMFDLARQVLVADIRSEHPGITQAELRVKIFERTYGPDFEPADRARIVARLRADATPPG